MARHRMAPHSAFARLSSKLLRHEPPCMSEAEDWESSAGFLAEEHLAKARQSTPDRLHLERTVTMASGGQGAGEQASVGARRLGGAEEQRCEAHILGGTHA